MSDGVRIPGLTLDVTIDPGPAKAGGAEARREFDRTAESGAAAAAKLDAAHAKSGSTLEGMGVKAGIAFGAISVGVLGALEATKVLTGAMEKFIATAYELGKISDEKFIAERGLAGALAKVGMASDQALEHYLAFSKGFKESAAIDDDTVQKSMTTLIRYLRLTGGDLERAQTGIVDWAALTGKSVEEVAFDVVRGASGMARAWRQYGLELDPALSKSEKLTKIMEFMELQSKGVAASLSYSLTGATHRLSIEWNDLLAKFGDYVARSPSIIEGITGLARVIGVVTDEIKPEKDIFKPWILGAYDLAISASQLADVLGGLQTQFSNFSGGLAGDIARQVLPGPLGVFFSQYADSLTKAALATADYNKESTRTLALMYERQQIAANSGLLLKSTALGVPGAPLSGLDDGSGLAALLAKSMENVPVPIHIKPDFVGINGARSESLKEFLQWSAGQFGDMSGSTMPDLGQMHSGIFGGLPTLLPDLETQFAGLKNEWQSGLISLDDYVSALEKLADAYGQVNSRGVALNKTTGQVAASDLAAAKQTQMLANMTRQTAQAFGQMASASIMAALAGGSWEKAINDMAKSMVATNLAFALENVALGIMASTVWGAAALGGTPAQFFKAAAVFGAAAAGWGVLAAASGGFGSESSRGAGADQGSTSSPAGIGAPAAAPPVINIYVEGHVLTADELARILADATKRQSGRAGM